MRLTRIWVHGAGGRMGRAVMDLAQRADDARLAGAIELRRDVEPAMPGVSIVRSSPPSEPGAVVIDFSRAGAVRALIAALQGSDLPLVCGTTGLDAEERELLYVYSKENPVFYAQNMSYGICLLVKLLRETRPLLTPFSDVEIVEFHHRHKRDYPSGTALALAEAIDGSAKVNVGRSASEETTGKHITVHSVRAGGIAGTHEVHFGADEEVLTFTHRALSRDVFARGAIRAANFIVAKKSGLFGMNDLLEHQHA